MCIPELGIALRSSKPPSLFLLLLFCHRLNVHTDVRCNRRPFVRSWNVGNPADNRCKDPLVAKSVTLPLPTPVVGSDPSAVTGLSLSLNPGSQTTQAHIQPWSNDTHSTCRPPYSFVFTFFFWVFFLLFPNTLLCDSRTAGSRSLLFYFISFGFFLVFICGGKGVRAKAAEQLFSYFCFLGLILDGKTVERAHRPREIL
ncbi:hypothetical protein QBC35DRAFT_493772 [Podospora australis]|uniref:Uncharacterized protein n=1 Tax=Podospora australis TaxID=1536484 RepID=A0AAN7AHY9_9PEZI|nr:hypothetical protein QBC35DRAFT_493772 [Podospora australis]